MLLKEIFVALGLEVDEAAFAKGQLAASLVEAGMKKIVEIGKEAVEAFVENTKHAIEYGNSIAKTSQAIGIATGALQELQYAGKLADLSAEEMSGGIGILSRKMQEAKSGSEEASKAFKGIEFQKGGKLRATDEVLGNIADKFQKMPDGAAKTALAMELFGRSGKRMIPLLNKGSAALEETRKEARELGLVMGGESVAASEELNDNLERLHMVSEGVWRGAIAPLLPAIGELVKRFLEWRKANAQIISSKIQSFLGYMIKAVNWLGDAMDFLIKNATAVKFILGTVGLTAVIIALAGWMSTLSAASVAAAIATTRAWLAAAAPFVAIAAIVAGFMLLFDDIRTYQQGGDSLYGRFKKEIDDWLKPRDEDPWFVTALKYFVRLLRDTIEVMLELDEIFGDGKKKQQFLDKQAGKNKGQMQMQTDAMTMEAARTRAQQGLPMTAVEKAALKRNNVTPEAFEAKYKGMAPKPAGSPETPGGAAAPQMNMSTPTMSVPSVPVPASSSSEPQVSAPMQFSITQQPGESGEGLAQRIGQVVNDVLQGKISAAVAGVRGGP